MTKFRNNYCFEVSKAKNIPIRTNGFETNDIGLSYVALLNEKKKQKFSSFKAKFLYFIHFQALLFRIVLFCYLELF